MKRLSFFLILFVLCLFVSCHQFEVKDSSLKGIAEWQSQSKLLYVNPETGESQVHSKYGISFSEQSMNFTEYEIDETSEYPFKKKLGKVYLIKQINNSTLEVFSLDKESLGRIEYSFRVEDGKIWLDVGGSFNLIESSFYRYQK